MMNTTFEENFKNNYSNQASDTIHDEDLIPFEAGYVADAYDSELDGPLG